MHIKDLRIAAGMTQANLANELGVDVSTVTKWETGASAPRAAQLPQIADLLHCTIDALFGRPGEGGEMQ